MLDEALTVRVEVGLTVGVDEALTVHVEVGLTANVDAGLPVCVNEEHVKNRAYTSGSCN